MKSDKKNAWSWVAIILSGLGIVFLIVFVVAEIWASVQIYNLANTLYQPVEKTYTKVDEYLNNTQTSLSTFQSTIQGLSFQNLTGDNLTLVSDRLQGVVTVLDVKVTDLSAGVQNTIDALNEANGKIDAVNTLTKRDIPTLSGERLGNLNDRLVTLSTDLKDAEKRLETPDGTVVNEVKTTLANRVGDVNSQVQAADQKVTDWKDQAEKTKNLVQLYTIISGTVMALFSGYLVYALADQIRLRYQLIRKNK